MTRPLLLALLAAVANAVSLQDLPNYSFEQYLKEFKLTFPAAEMALRKLMFVREVDRVIAHNAKNASWKEGINKFSVLTPLEMKSYMGRNKRAHKAHSQLATSKPLPADFEVKPVSSLPKSVDWRDANVMTAVKDQGHCGSCWAFASTAVIESHVAIKSGLLFDLSVQQIAMCAPNNDHCGGTGKCEGSTAELAFDYLTSARGIYQEYQYGYISYTGEDFNCTIPSGTPVADTNGYTNLPNNDYATLMNAIATVGPIAINVDASTWHAYTSGVFEGCSTTSLDINHVVVLAGYGVDAETGKKYWLVRNSWSPHYGEKGYIRLARYDDDSERCAVDSTPQDGIECGGQDDPISVCGTCGVIYDSSYPLDAKAF